MRLANQQSAQRTPASSAVVTKTDLEVARRVRELLDMAGDLAQLRFKMDDGSDVSLGMAYTDPQGVGLSILVSGLRAVVRYHEPCRHPHAAVGGYSRQHSGASHGGPVLPDQQLRSPVALPHPPDPGSVRIIFRRTPVVCRAYKQSEVVTLLQVGDVRDILA